VTCNPNFDFWYIINNTRKATCTLNLMFTFSVDHLWPNYHCIIKENLSHTIIGFQMYNMIFSHVYMFISWWLLFVFREKMDTVCCIYKHINMREYHIIHLEANYSMGKVFFYASPGPILLSSFSASLPWSSTKTNFSIGNKILYLTSNANYFM
jgi:hypothetical protein